MDAREIARRQRLEGQEWRSGRDGLQNPGGGTTKDPKFATMSLRWAVFGSWCCCPWRDSD